MMKMRLKILIIAVLFLNFFHSFSQYYRDNDNDGYGAGIPYFFPEVGYNYATNDDDCNDNNAAINPGKSESCNGIDDNCNSQVDEGFLPLASGAINGIQSICYSGNPFILGNVSSASGAGGGYSYQWQYSVNGSSGWTNIAGASGTSYDPPGGLTSDRWYRRRVQSCFQTKYTSSVKVTVYGNLTAGSINNVQTICYGGNPSTLGNASSANGGNASYSYQWQYSANGSSGWTNIGGASGTSYDPPGGLTSDRWYRRRVQSCSQTKYTGTVKVTIRPNLLAGSINGAQSICKGTDPSILGNASSPSGGDGSYSYQWQYSSNGSSPWTDISGAISSTYNPPSGLNNDRWYRREVISCGQTKYTSSIKVTVSAPPIWYADIDGDGFGDDSETIASCTQPSGFVSNNTDSCPFEFGPTTGCDYQSVTFSDENYVYSRTYQREKTSAAQINRNSDVLEAITYYDGLGRPMQQIGIKASPKGKDIVTHIGYDAFGRSEKEWLPYRASSGSLGTYRSSAEADTDAYYVANYGAEMGITPNPFSQKEMEASPLNRILKQAAPGQDWQLGEDHEIEFEYGTNTTNEVRLFSTATSYTNSIYEPVLVDGSGNSYYGPGQLYKNVTKDENHNGTFSKLHSTEEFKDKQGRVVLKRTYALVNNVETPHDTYYVYDNYGNLSYVLPPKVDTSNGVSATELEELCYQYKYDGRNRLVEKKIPGKGWEYIVYNKLDQPVMTQDPNLHNQDKWLFTKYDALGRVAYTGVINNAGDRDYMVSVMEGATHEYVTKTSIPTSIGGTDVYYTNDAKPININEVYTINYYDGYVDNDGLWVPSTVLDQTTATNVTGLATVTKARVLGTNDWITTITGYDSKGRNIYTASKNDNLKTTDIVSTELDFGGKVLQQQSEHTKSGNATITVADSFGYDHAGRLVLQQQTLGGHTETLLLNRYDDLGQLASRDVGNTVGSPLQTVDYAYNVRGWLKKINDPANLDDDLFALGINYNQAQYGGAPLYNGNISETYWKTSNDGVLRRYRYEYDALNRLKLAAFNLGDNSQPHRYSESGISYDKNGNILTLQRMGHLNGGATTFGTMDNLVYGYDNGNKLNKVADNANDTYGFVDGADQPTEYIYDANGNMISDANKGITNIGYNHLNLPTTITIGQGNISYIYDANGTKLKKTVSTGTITEYARNYIYGNGTLQFFSTPEGYVTPDGMGGYDYVYQYKDHLGNIRLSYVDNSGNLEIVEENNYYPFGLKHKGYNDNGISSLGNDVAQKWKFGGKEYDETFDINTYDFGARNYDPALGRWFNTDPMEQFASPYVYAGNDPIRYMDPTGMYSTEEWKRDNGITNDDVEEVYNSEEGIQDDIRFRDENGNLIATYYTDKVDDDVYLPVSDENSKNLNLNVLMGEVDLEDIDAIGIGGSWDFTFVMGGGVSLEAIYFLDGKDKGKHEFFKTKRQNVGVNGGAGVYGIFADYKGADSELTVGDYKGKSFALSLGVKGTWMGSYSKFWAPRNPENDKSGFKSLFNENLRLWSGYTAGGGAGAGVQWSRQNTTIYKP